MTLFALLKWLHVLSAIVAVGTNVTYSVWLVRAARKPEMLPFTLRTVKILDDRLANPGYGLLLVTGLAMAFVAPLPLTTPWILASLILYGIVFLIAMLGYSPALRHQVRLAESGGHQSAEYAAVERRATILGIVIGLLGVTIVFFMVTKPSLWG